MFLDADDILAPSFIEECDALAGSDAGYAYATAQRFGADDVTWEAQPFNPGVEAPELHPGDSSMDLAKLDDVRFDSATAWEDWEFFVNLASRGVYGVPAPRAIFYYRKHAGRDSRLDRFDRDPLAEPRALRYIQRKNRSLFTLRERAANEKRILRLRLHREVVTSTHPKSRCRRCNNGLIVSSLGQRQFRIASFVNRPELYVAMRQSFEAAGFVEPLAHYTVETGDPYTAITRLGQADEPYVILVHQDVFCDQGFTASDLLARLEELTKLDDRWAIAGNSGGDSDHQLRLHLNHPDCQFRSTRLPHQVVTLDENMLILRTARRPHCSPELSGFHLYGADACLHAAQDGSTCYVIDFPVTHLSNGNEDGRTEAMRSFCSCPGSRPGTFASPGACSCCLVANPCVAFFTTR